VNLFSSQGFSTLYSLRFAYDRDIHRLPLLVNNLRTSG